MEKKNNIDFYEEEIKNNIPQKSKKPNWFVCFFKVLATVSFGGFIGKDLVTGEKVPNRFLSFLNNVFRLIMQSLPVALFVSYFLITLPTWLFVLAIVEMASELFKLVYTTNQARTYLDNPQKQKKTEEQAKNHAKFYIYGQKYYKNRPTTLIGDFFRHIGISYFAFLFGKDFMSGKKIERSQSAKGNIINIISMLCFWALVILCFLITIPKWLFVFAIVAAVAKLAHTFCVCYSMRQCLTQDLFFCKCQGENQVHASSKQVEENNRADVPAQFEFIDKNDVADHH